MVIRFSLRILIHNLKRGRFTIGGAVKMYDTNNKMRNYIYVQNLAELITISGFKNSIQQNIENKLIQVSTFL